jgi:nucleoid DNA-binding protein
MANALDSLNLKEQVDAIAASLKAEGVEVTKTIIDKILDKQRSLGFNALVAHKAIKWQDFGTLEVHSHAERPYKVPDGKGGFLEGKIPAGYHVKFVESKKLLDALNNVKA